MKTRILVLVFFSFGLCQYLFASVVFKQGLVVLDGVAQKNIQTLEKKSLIICDPVCEIIVDNNKSLIYFSGFASLEQMLKLNLMKNEALALNKMLSANQNNFEAKQVQPKLPEKDLPMPAANPRNLDGLKVSKITPSQAEAVPHLRAPYPPNHTLFLYKHAGRIYFLPKEFCSNRCEATLDISGQTLAHEEFSAGQNPIFFVTFENKTWGKFYVRFKDGNEGQQFDFELQPLDDDLLSNAIVAARPVELLP